MLENAHLEAICAGDEVQGERQKTYQFASVNSLPLIPLTVQGKKTLDANHGDASWAVGKYESWNNAYQIHVLEARPTLNLGVLFCNNVIDIDIDSTNPYLHTALKHYLRMMPTPYTWGRASKPLSHMAFVLAEAFDREEHASAIRALAAWEDLRVELRGGDPKSNFFSAAPGSVHESGEVVKWGKHFDPNVTPAPLRDVTSLVWALRRAVAAALVAEHINSGQRHYSFLPLFGMLVRMARQAEDSGTPEAAMNEHESLEFTHVVQELIGDTDYRDDSFASTWRKYMADPSIKISGGTEFAHRITQAGGDGERVRNLVYKLLVDNPNFEVAEAALERFILVQTPQAGIMDLHHLRPNLRIPAPMRPEELSLLYTSVRIPLGDKVVPLPQFLKNSSQVTRAAGIELRPDLPPGTTYTVSHNKDEHGYDDESTWINAWVGFQYPKYDSVIPDSEVQPFLDYVYEVVANKDDQRFEWVMAWIADIFQDPANKPGTLLALTGPQGSGKTMLGEIVGSIIGSAHYGKIGSIEDLTKEFNSRVHHKLFVQADETGSTQRTALARDLKELVTGLYQMIVYKGREGILSFNPARYYFTSNYSGDALRVEPGNERRYTIFETGHGRVGDLDYWDQFYRWWNSKGVLRKLHTYLSQIKYQKQLIRKAMGTAEKKQHQMNALPPIVQWAIQRISEGHPLDPDTHQYSYQAYSAVAVEKDGKVHVGAAPDSVSRETWPNLVEAASLTSDFNAWLRANNIRSQQHLTAVTRLLDEISKTAPIHKVSIRARRAGVMIRPKLITFPTRQQFIDGLVAAYPVLEDEIRLAAGPEAESHFETETERSEY